MTRTVSTSEAKNQLSALINEVASGGDAIVVESHSRPRAVIVSLDDYKELEAERERKRRAQLLAQLRELAAGIGDRNADLSEEEAMALADRFVHEVFEEMAASGKIRFHDPPAAPD